MRQIAALTLLFTSGCALNAVLDVDMQLPYGGAGDRAFAFVEVLSGPIPPRCTAGMVADCFSPDLPIVEGRSFAIDGRGADRCSDLDRDCNVRFSVLSENVDLEALHMRVNLCTTPECTGPTEDANAPYYLFEVARPFYRGRVTQWSPTSGPYAADMIVTPQPTMPGEERLYRAHRCEVRGCSGGSPIGDRRLGWCDEGRSDSCTDLNCRGRHFCER